MNEFNYGYEQKNNNDFNNQNEQNSTYSNIEKSIYEEDAKKTKKEKKIKNNDNQDNPNKKKKFYFNSVLAFIAYIGIGCIALALLLTLIFKGDTKVSNAFASVGQVIAYILCIILAFQWVKSHKKIGWIVCYVIFVVTIVVLFILTI